MPRIALNEQQFRSLVMGEEVVVDDVHLILSDIGWHRITAAIAHRRAEAAYHDESYTARRCDHCQRLYQGPSVYCSLDCAVADA